MSSRLLHHCPLKLLISQLERHNRVKPVVTRTSGHNRRIAIVPLGEQKQILVVVLLKIGANIVEM